MISILCADLLSATQEDYARLYENASPERKQRADRCLRMEDRLRCVAADALLRKASGSDACVPARTDRGKPFLPDRPDFQFSLSHSGRYAVIAFGTAGVGVDVERIREDVDIEAMSRRFFSPEEQQYVRERPEDSRRRFFFIWTGKESFGKYLGTGLKGNIRALGVIPPEKGVRFFGKELPGGYVLSLCTEDTQYRLEMLQPEQLL